MTEKICGIYKITSPTGRVYIGQSKDIKRRKRDYKRISKVKGQPLLEKSILKYGWEFHTFEIIEECEFEQLNIKERYWQDFYDVLNGGLNCILQNTDTMKGVYSTETKLRLSESKMGKLNPNFGKKIPQETIKKRTVQMMRGDNHKAREVLCTETGIFYDSLVSASIAYNINYAHLNQMVNKKCNAINRTSLVYADEYIVGEKLKRDKKEMKGRSVLNVLTGEVYPSIKKASEELNMNYSTFKSILYFKRDNNFKLIKK